jgi:DNA mismatch repair ATPase MutS
MDFVLTTHYISLCNLLDNNKNICNQQMKIINDNYTYKLIKGISNIKGGITVLEKLSYPDEILISAKKVIDKIII